MKKSDLLLIANYFLRKIRGNPNDPSAPRGLAEYSSNRPCIDRQAPRRTLQLDLLTARRDRYGIREKITNWHLNLKDPTYEKSFWNKRVKVQLPNITSTFSTTNKICGYICSLPKKINKTHHKDGKQVATLEYFENTAKREVQLGIGNCDYLAILALVLLIEYPAEGLPELDLPPLDTKNILTEIVGTKKGDHFFLVINRNLASQLTDLSTWGDAIILDPWMNQVLDVQEWLTNPPSTKMEDPDEEYTAAYCFNFIKGWQIDLTRAKNDYAYLGEGHTQRWIRNRTKKAEPVNLRDWKPRDYDATEQIPWVEEPVRKKRKI